MSGCSKTAGCNTCKSIGIWVNKLFTCPVLLSSCPLVLLSSSCLPVLKKRKKTLYKSLICFEFCHSNGFFHREFWKNYFIVVLKVAHISWKLEQTTLKCTSKYIVFIDSQVKRPFETSPTGNKIDEDRTAKQLATD